MRMDEDWLLKIFTAHGRCIKHLDAHWGLIVNAVAAAQTCTRLETLSVSHHKWNTTRPEMAHHLVWNPPGVSSDRESLRTWAQHQRILGRWLYLLVQANAGTLRELRWDHVTTFREFNQEEVDGMLRSCQRLTRLEIFDRGPTPKTDIVQLLVHVPQIQHFVDRSVWWNMTLLDATMSQLISLHLEAQVPIQSVFQLLKKLPHLQKLQFHWQNYEYRHLDVLGTILNYTPSRLQGLHIRGIKLEDDQYLATQMLPWLPDLVDISLAQMGPTLASLIPTSYRFLRSYRQPDPAKTICPTTLRSYSAVNTLGVLLENCPFLTEFDGIEHKIEADYLMSHPWICKRLETLRFQIVGVHRLSEEEETDYRQGILYQKLKKSLSEEEKKAIEKHERLQQQQYQVYDRLAELIHLRVLDLGAEFRLPQGRYGPPVIKRGVHVYENDDKPIPDTLALSLASGLDRLLTLRKLEVFGFEGVNHRIDYEELRWMGSNWPRLRVMRGLQVVDTDNLQLAETSYVLRSLPTEILNAIGSYLSHKDCLHSAQVSRSWNSVFICQLWKSIDDTHHAWPRILKRYDSDTARTCGQDEAWLIGIFTKYGQHIRHLNLHWKVTIKAISSTCNNTSVSCPNLKSLSISNALTGPLLSPIFENAFEPAVRGIRTEGQQLDDWKLIQQFWLLVRQNPQLMVLKIDDSLDELVAMNTLGFVDSMVLDNLTSLVDLKYSALRCDTSTLLSRLPRLKFLQAQVVFSDGGVLTGSFANLQYLNASHSLSLAEMVNLLQRLPNLRELSVSQIRYAAEEDSKIESMDRTPSALQRLRINWSSTYDVLSLKGLSPWLPRLTHLTIAKLRHNVVSILEAYYPQLECLTDSLESTRSRAGQIALQSGVVATVLATCSNLISVNAQVHSIDINYDTGEPWECQGLEVLHCQLCGFSRFTQTEESIYSAGNTHSAAKMALSYLLMDGYDYDESELDPDQILAKYEACQEQHVRAYDQLANLRHLKSLQLGVRRGVGVSLYPSHLRREDTLELSLASGLSRLGALTDLEVFGFEGTSHRIGKAELEWMANAWPRLRELRGLDDSCHSWPRIIKSHDSDEAQETSFNEDRIIRTLASHTNITSNSPSNYNVLLDKTFAGLRSIDTIALCSFTNVVTLLNILPGLEYLSVQWISDTPSKTDAGALMDPEPRVLRDLSMLYPCPRKLWTSCSPVPELTSSSIAETMAKDKTIPISVAHFPDDLSHLKDPSDREVLSDHEDQNSSDEHVKPVSKDCIGADLFKGLRFPYIFLSYMLDFAELEENAVNEDKDTLPPKFLFDEKKLKLVHLLTRWTSASARAKAHVLDRNKTGYGDIGDPSSTANTLTKKKKLVEADAFDEKYKESVHRRFEKIHSAAINVVPHITRNSVGPLRPEFGENFFHVQAHSEDCVHIRRNYFAPPVRPGSGCLFGQFIIWFEIIECCIAQGFGP
ncbi:hypothetical protein BGZ95_010984 [Linnemannia exigua]|uniref:F-box domain-containing protein n=1 Tax=Linnemannia exigua TaxID=604196 RepID=A0AAD4DAJ0_9FUNG|nr:hypothetical protein BGZ95_010984 [Linnemannia exigua]